MSSSTDRAERVKNPKTDQTERHTGVKPRDAATLILVDRSGAKPAMLLGKRSSRHVFMPDTYVFPGGRRDKRDHALPFQRDLHPVVTERLMQATSQRFTAATARGLALAAARELTEETGLSLGQPAPDLSCLRYVARAITPPGLIRRFDTRFFLAFTDEAGVDRQAVTESAELSDLTWMTMEDTRHRSLPEITRMVLDEVAMLMDKDQTLSHGHIVPFYHERHGRYLRSEL